MKTQTFQFTEDVFVDKTGSERVLARKGLTFTAQLAEEIIYPRPNSRDPSPPPTATGRWNVVAADVEILVGCLTSCIRTQRCTPTGPARDIA